MLPRFRLRWERKDVNGGHPLIFELASHVLGVGLHAVKPATEPVLLSEPEWDEDSAMLSPISTSQHVPDPGEHCPLMVHVGGPMTPTSANSAGGKHLVDILTGLFYPFFSDENFRPPLDSQGVNPSY
ncbi:hypothetical protein B0H11DRAFT_2385513 [Mycena galericulata]|nr:hypothetical protein B0H11DRAFT_2385513 [Mycena galericulata]